MVNINSVTCGSLANQTPFGWTFDQPVPTGIPFALPQMVVNSDLLMFLAPLGTVA